MALSEPVLTLKPGREKSLLRRHPWVFSGAVGGISGDPASGDTLRIQSADKVFLGWGAYSPASQITARIWAFDPQASVDEALIDSRIGQALKTRQNTFSPEVNDSLRLVHAESDGLPGLIADRYGDWLVVQFLSCGPERWRKEIIAALAARLQPRGIYERSDVEVRSLEGMPLRTGLVWGEAPPEYLCIHSNGLKFWVDLYKGHKTGFYLDQSENHALVGALAKGRQILDCFCYTGAFSVAALVGGASQVTALDSSSEALAIAGRNVSLNSLDPDRLAVVEGDVFQVLRKMRDQRSTFDLIVLDPPKFAPTASHVERAARGYKDINLLAFKLLRPGGILVTFSCSGGVDRGLFQKIVASAALDAGVDGLILQVLQQSRDHPVGLAFPEGEYLKGLVIKKR